MKYKYYNGTSWVELADKSELGSLAFLNTLDKLTTTSGYLQYSGNASTYDLHKNQKRSGGLQDLNYYYQLPSEGTLAAPVVLASRSWVINQGYSTLVLGNTSTTAAAGNHTHNYAGSSSAGGAATSANKLNTDAGSTTNPVYFSNGIPNACTYSLNKSVPSNAVFTDTNQTVKGAGTAFGASAAVDIVAGSNVTITPDTTNNKITIAASQPTVNNATLTIQKNGTTVKTFTANASSDVTANITVPTKGSDLTNDLGWTSNTGNITGSISTSNYVVFTNGTNAIKSSSYIVAQSANWDSTSDITLATMKGVATYVTGLGYITGITSSDVTTALGYTPGTSNLTIGTTASTAAAGNHAHGNISNTGTISSTPVTSASGVLVYDANNKIQRATADQTRSIIGAGTVTSVSASGVAPLQVTELGTAATPNKQVSFVNQSPNKVLAGPSSGSTAGAPTFRALVEADLPSISKLTASSGKTYFEWTGSNQDAWNLHIHYNKTLSPTVAASDHYYAFPESTDSSNPVTLGKATYTHYISLANPVIKSYGSLGGGGSYCVVSFVITNNDPTPFASVGDLSDYLLTYHFISGYDGNKITGILPATGSVQFYYTNNKSFYGQPVSVGYYQPASNQKYIGVCCFLVENSNAGQLEINPNLDFQCWITSAEVEDIIIPD